MNTSRRLTISVLLSLSVVSGCVRTKPESLAELVAANTPSLDQIEVEPNPLTLVVGIDKEGGLTLNQESMGTTDNTKQLRQRLKEIFAERERKRVYEPGSDRIAKAVLVKAPRSARYVVVVEVIEAIKAEGGNPIGLETDDLDESQR